MSTDERVAYERLERACDLIRSAYRLHPLDPSVVISRVKSAVTAGAEDMASDIAEAARWLLVADSRRAETPPDGSLGGTVNGARGTEQVSEGRWLSGRKRRVANPLSGPSARSVSSNLTLPVASSERTGARATVGITASWTLPTGFGLAPSAGVTSA